ncbi:MAG: hypothetical protein AAFT19_05060 [Pseudomonadota bacterium]
MLAGPAITAEPVDWLARCLDGDPQGEPDTVLEACDIVLAGGVTGADAERARFNRGLALQMLDQQTAPSLRVEPSVEVEIRPRPRPRLD